MYGIGIDVAKGKSMVAVRKPTGEMLFPPFEVSHTKSGMKSLTDMIRSVDGELRVVMEQTGRYYEPIARALTQAGFFVSAVNPMLIKHFDNESLRKVKSDKADAVKISRYALDKWSYLKQYTVMNDLRESLKLMNRQLDFFSRQKTAMKNNLISVLDQTFPGVNAFFNSPARIDGSQKWVDFTDTYWHADCVCSMSSNAFTDHYRKWCRRKKYNFNASKAEEIYQTAKDLLPVLPKNDLSKLLVKQAVNEVKTTSQAIEKLKKRMNEVASQLPEYPVVMNMKGVGPSLGSQIIAKIGDVTRFTHKGALTAFAGVDPGVDESGDHKSGSVPVTKRGSARLRKALFQVMDVLIKTHPEDDDVYQFLDRKRSEGKPYYVYMTAGMNKFLRVYYGRVNQYLASLEPKTE